MAHPEQVRFIEILKQHVFGELSDSTILEVGSYDVNGTVRKLFRESKRYIGADLSIGPGVDIAVSGHLLDLPDGSIDISISCECFEHNPFWKETFQNMVRMTSLGGYVVITCATTGRIEHGTARSTLSLSPGTAAMGIEYYKNLTVRDFEAVLIGMDCFSDFAFWTITASCDLYFVGRRVGQAAGNAGRLSDLSERILEIEHLSAASRGVVRQLAFRTYRTPLSWAAKLLSEAAFQDFALWYDRWLSRFKW